MNKTDYFHSESELPHYLPYPNFLLKSGLSMTASTLYAVLLNRTTLSQKMGWTDEQGRVFCIYTIEELGRKLGRSDTTIKNAMKELVEADLLVKKRITFQGPNRLYLKCDFTMPEKSEPKTLQYNTDATPLQQQATPMQHHPEPISKLPGMPPGPWDNW